MVVDPDDADHEDPAAPIAVAERAADEDQRRIGRPWDGALRVPGLVAEDGRGLEADVTDQGKQQPNAQ